MSEPVLKQPLSDVICEALRKDILDGVLKPGERLMEIHYAQKLGVSRTPFREAVRRLEIEGLVTVLPRRGAHVSLLSKKDITEVLDIRSALDMLAAELFIKNAGDAAMDNLERLAGAFDKAVEANDLKQQIKSDVEFHEYIYAKSDNERLLHLYSGFKDQLYRYRVLYLKTTPRGYFISDEHGKIMEAVRNRNIDAAREISKIHIVNQKNSFKTK